MDVDPRCEACRNAPIALDVDDDDPDYPYRLCHPCAERLRRYALRPLEWFNLAARYGWGNFLLHDDFYDQDGEASQPDTSHYSSRGMLAPTFDQARGSLDRLLDFCVTRWSLGQVDYAGLRAYPAIDVLREIEGRAERGNGRVFETMLVVCANVLGSTGAGWVRAQYGRACREALLFSWCEAAAKCLAQDEGLQLAIDALRHLEGRPFRDAKGGLLWFRSPKILDWIEANAPATNVTEDWGRLAALSDLDMARVEKWIAAGRPFNLVAMDALSELIPRPSLAMIVRRLDPALQGCGDRSLILPLLDRAKSLDSSPRVSRIADFIAANVRALRIA